MVVLHIKFHYQSSATIIISRISYYQIYVRHKIAKLCTIVLYKVRVVGTQSAFATSWPPSLIFNLAHSIANNTMQHAHFNFIYGTSMIFSYIYKFFELISWFCQDTSLGFARTPVLVLQGHQSWFCKDTSFGFAKTPVLVL